MLEIKSDPEFAQDIDYRRQLIEIIIGLVRAAGVAQRTLLHSFDWDLLAECARQAPDIPISFLTQMPKNMPHQGEDSAHSISPGFSGCEDDFVPVAGRAKVVLEARLVLAGYAVVLIAIVFLNFQVLLWIWLVPVVLGQPFLRLYLLAEHGRCPQVANMLHNSRTTYTNALVRRLAWNMPYHAEHHSYPGVPFHQLPNFHQIIQSHIRETEQGYIRFNAKYIQSFERSGEVAESLGNDDGNGGRPQADSEPPPGAG